MAIHEQTASFDVVVVGGGFSGVCAAIAAAREGAKVALVQNRPVFGGSGSSETRMHIVGANCHSSKPNLRETGILEEILLEKNAATPMRTSRYSIPSSGKRCGWSRTSPSS